MHASAGSAQRNWRTRQAGSTATGACRSAGWTGSAHTSKSADERRIATCARDRRAARRRLRGIHLEGRAGRLLRHRRPGLDRQVRVRPPSGRPWTVTFGPSPDHLYHHRSVFEIVDRPRRLVLATTEHRPDRPSFDFSVEFTFEDEDGRTLMTVIQSGFPTAELRDEHGRGVPNAFHDSNAPSARARRTGSATVP